jgi:hypothetical protein
MNHRLALVCLLAACGGDPEILGFYATTHHTLNSESCDAEGPAQSDPPYFHVVSEKFFGVEIVSARPCDGDSELDCDGFGFASFFGKSGGVWVGEISASSGGADGFSCRLLYFLDRATLDGETLRIEATRYSEEDDTLMGDACDPDVAERRGDSMPCERLQVIEGIRVER